MKKVKIFLGGYINYTNAQNLNCRALAIYLDKDKFEIFTLVVHFGEKTLVSTWVHTSAAKLRYQTF